MKNKVLKISSTCLFMIAIVISCYFGIILTSRKISMNRNDFSYLYKKTKKVILFIGDGMGENHIDISEKYLDKKMIFESFAYSGYVTTFSNSLFLPTDSAAAATAMATGYKVNNEEVSTYKGKKLETISEYVKKLNKGVGIVTTDSLDGATPACFSSHANNRNDKRSIIEGQINSGIDLFLGAGYKNYLSHRKTIEEKNYFFTNQFDKLTIDHKKIFGCFEEISNYKSTNIRPTLKALVEFAINYMENTYPNGYFLMIESAHIDKMSHKNDIFKMIEYLDEFDNAIQYAYQQLLRTNDVALIVTADHETGGIKNFHGSKEDISNKLFTKMSHSNQNVKYFINITSIDNENYFTMPLEIDNTNVYDICYQLIS